jgi:hypothetical protein
MTESFPNPMTSTLFLSAFLLQEQRLPDLPSLRTETVFLTRLQRSPVWVENAGISTVAQLTEWSETELLKLHGMGPVPCPSCGLRCPRSANHLNAHKWTFR